MRILFPSSDKSEMDKRKALAREILALVRDLGLVPSYWLTGPLCREMERWYSSKRFYAMHKEFDKVVSTMLGAASFEMDAAAFFNHLRAGSKHLEETWHDQYKLEFPE